MQQPGERVELGADQREPLQPGGGRRRVAVEQRAPVAERGGHRRGRRQRPPRQHRLRRPEQRLRAARCAGPPPARRPRAAARPPRWRPRSGRATSRALTSSVWAVSSAAAAGWLAGTRGMASGPSNGTASSSALVRCGGRGRLRSAVTTAVERGRAWRPRGRRARRRRPIPGWSCPAPTSAPETKSPAVSGDDAVQLRDPVAEQCSSSASPPVAEPRARRRAAPARRRRPRAPGRRTRARCAAPARWAGPARSAGWPARPRAGPRPRSASETGVSTVVVPSPALSSAPNCPVRRACRAGWPTQASSSGSAAPRASRGQPAGSAAFWRTTATRCATVCPDRGEPT